MGVRNTCGATFFVTDSVIVIGTRVKGKRQYRPLSSWAPVTSVWFFRSAVFPLPLYLVEVVATAILMSEQSGPVQ